MASRFLEDVEKRFDEMRARSEQRKMDELAKKAKQEAERAAKKNRSSSLF